MLAAEAGADVVPVWNKSNREHTTVGSQPDSVRAAADAAVRELGWKKPYHVDADHIRLETVDGFIASSDFYTIDVADSIGQPAAEGQVKAFADRHAELVGRLAIPGIERPFEITRATGRADRRQVSASRHGSGRDLSAYCRGQGRGDVHHRSVDGRDRQSADAARAAGHPGGHCGPGNSHPDRSRRSSPAASTRESTTSATWPSSKRNFNRTWR